jgi:hypothetical protein
MLVVPDDGWWHTHLHFNELLGRNVGWVFKRDVSGSKHPPNTFSPASTLEVVELHRPSWLLDRHFALPTETATTRKELGEHQSNHGAHCYPYLVPEGVRERAKPFSRHSSTSRVGQRAGGFDWYHVDHHKQAGIEDEPRWACSACHVPVGSVSPCTPYIMMSCLVSSFSLVGDVPRLTTNHQHGNTRHQLLPLGR